MKERIIVVFVAVLCFLALVGSGFAQTTLVVATEDRPLQKIISEYTAEFEEMTGAKVEYVYYPSAELRSKIRLDASLGTGTFHVIYFTEASVAEQASNGWVVPIKEYYPEEYDFDDFFPSIVGILSYEDTAYGAPLSAETTWLMYRKDLFDEKGIAVPKTLDEYIEACKQFDKDKFIFGGVVRGDRGHGYNVWRWTQFFAVVGGKYMENGEWVFDKYIDEAVTATDYYLKVIETSPPGGERFSYLDAWDSFNAGRVATFIAATPKYSVSEDPEKSAAAGKIGYAPPPYLSTQAASGAAHGYAISSVGSKTEEMKTLAGKFIGWASSKEIEVKRALAGQINVARASTFENEKFKAQLPAEHLQALADTLEITQVCIPLIPEWPEIGDNLGIILEEIFVGTRKDIRAGLQEAADFGKKVLQK